MSFSAEWLAMREAADQSARDPYLLSLAADAAGPDPLVLDLGSGTGAMMRALRPHLPASASWRLVDHDPALLSYASKATQRNIECLMQDLGNVDALPLEGATLVTASALLDLMPARWISALSRRLLDARLPFYAALSYDGCMEWDPMLPDDVIVTAAYNRHQKRDKGLGPALGPDAGRQAVETFRLAGFQVLRADSNWDLGIEHAGLQRELLQGIATVAAEAGLRDAQEWASLRMARIETTRWEIGHVDLLALPPG
ncbi:class I SAM-dependent methyltransferase [Paracoccus sp. MBLB3053]|uniref:Class I SAM-dependent methyltransferase n=1 Tax=Paracoccus aurantius TaxID=3073814 RepID=A0ABU2HPH5_9RHOB|nr:class I SAM-dependent methyltransferase [Paracoccus sp. MBLB3053]MDS9466204.1 class I SAM-dependent methyltransferase [Paracoccus sp. MBLB3053]